MSIVNVKIVLVKKEKQTRERPTQGWILHRNTMTEIAWEDDVQRLGKAMSTVASEKNR